MSLRNAGRLARWGLAAWVALQAVFAWAGQEVPLRLIAVNDFHGALIARPLSGEHPQVQVGGAAHLAGWIRALRDDQPHVLVLGTGDLIGASPLESSLFWDEPTIELLNRIGMDAAVVGNHEFDKGMTEFLRMQRGGCSVSVNTAKRSCADGWGSFGGSKFTWLGANVVDAQGQPVLPSVVVRQVGAARVGIVGVVTRDTHQLVSPAGILGLRFEDEAQTLRKYAVQLRARGVQTVIALVHEGGTIRGDWNDARCPGAAGRIFEIARAVAGDIDVVFSGHSHQGYNCRIGSMPVMQAQAHGRGVSVVDLRIDAETGKVAASSVRSFNAYLTDGPAPVHEPGSEAAQTAARMRPDVDAQALAQRYERLARQEGSRVVGRLAQAAPHPSAIAGVGESAAGRLVADAQWHATRGTDRGQADFALMNPGGIRAGLSCQPSPCDVSFSQIFQMQPFGNHLVTMTLTGQQVRRLLEQQAPVGSRTASRFLQPSASLRYEWAPQAPAGERAQSIEIAGQALEPHRLYRVTVNSFLAEGGDGFTVLKEGREILVGEEDVKALSDYLSNSTIQPVVIPDMPRIRILGVN